MQKRSRHKSLLSEMWRNRSGYLFILPFYTIFLIFMLFPVLYSLYLSFCKTMGGIGKSPFIGLTNYINLLKDTQFITAVQNTTKFVIIQVPLMLALALFLALILNSKRLYFRNFFRSAIFLPSVMSLVVAALAFSMILNEDMGLLNMMLGFFGIPAQDWLYDPKLAFWAIMAIVTWRWTGYNAVIMLAGLQNIDENLYEAAKIDGAGPLQILRYIIIPLLWPIIFFCLIVGTIGVFQLFDEPMILTQGGPINRTLSISLYLYKTAFKKLRFGYGSAIAYFLVIILVIVTAINFKLFGKKYQ